MRLCLAIPAVALVACTGPSTSNSRSTTPNAVEASAVTQPDDAPRSTTPQAEDSNEEETRPRRSLSLDSKTSPTISQGPEIDDDDPTPPSERAGSGLRLGRLDARSIRKTVRGEHQRIQHCYERELLAQPHLKGRVTVSFTIGPDGQVVKASGKGLSPRVSSCVSRIVKTIRFPQPSGGGQVEVEHPFYFGQGG